MRFKHAYGVVRAEFAAQAHGLVVKVAVQLQHRVPLAETREDHDRLARRTATDPWSGMSTWMNRCRTSSHASRAQTRSRRREVLCPAGFGGFPFPGL